MALFSFGQSDSKVSETLAKEGQRALELLVDNSFQLAGIDPRTGLPNGQRSSLQLPTNAATEAGRTALQNALRLDSIGPAALQRQVTGTIDPRTGLSGISVSRSDPLGVNPFSEMADVGGMSDFAGIATYGGVNPNTQGADAGTVNPVTGVANYGSFNPLQNPDAARELLRQSVDGVNPATGRATVNMTGFDEVADMVRRQATQAVGDRFSMAGRSGSKAEGNAIAQAVTEGLAPYAFNAYESAQGRDLAAQTDALARKFAANQNLADRRRAVGESGLDRAQMTQENFFDRMLSAEEAAKSRGFAANESLRDRRLTSSLDERAREFAAQENFFDRRLGAETDALNRGFTGEQNYFDRLFSGSTDQMNRGFSGFESLAARDMASKENFLDRMLSARTDTAGRQFQNYQLERDRQEQAIRDYLDVRQGNAENQLQAGELIRRDQLANRMAPYQEFALYTDPLVAALSGAPRTRVGSSDSFGFNFGDSGGFDAGDLLSLFG